MASIETESVGDLCFRPLERYAIGMSTALSETTAGEEQGWKSYLPGALVNWGPVVPVLRFSGPIGAVTPLRPGLSLASSAHAIKRAFSMRGAKAVAIQINSPGGSAVQSMLIHHRIRDLAAEKNIKVYVFAEDVAASGGYLLALAGDEIYASPSSIVGSIGVITATFGFQELIAKIGVERRVYTAGLNKDTLDPFLPAKEEDVERIKDIQRDVHADFIALVKERRGSKLNGPDETLFSGAFWSGRKALEFGLIDGLVDLRTKMRDVLGEDVRLRPISTPTSWLRRRRSFSVDDAVGLGLSPGGLAADFISAIEARALWSRFGL